MRPSFWIRFFAIFVYLFAFDWIVHGMILAPAYKVPSEVWRSSDEMSGYLIWMILSQAFTAVIFCYLFNKSWRGGRSIGAIKWGAVVGSLFAASYLMHYAVSPYPFSLIFTWMTAGIVQFAGAGFLLAKMHRNH